jgi:hypothetical protein
MNQAHNKIIIDHASSYEKKIENHPFHSYSPIHRGQAAYILSNCSANDIYANYISGKVRIYNNRKFDLFLSIIEKSLKAYNPCLNFTKNIHIYQGGNKQIKAIGIRSKNCIYTYETNIPNLICNQYVGNIPTVAKIKIFSTQEEFLSSMTSIIKEK